MNMYVRRFLLFFALCAFLLGCWFVFLRTTVTRTTGPTVQVWLTTSNGSSQLTPQPNITFGSNTGNSSTITVDEFQTLQQMTGFGAAVTPQNEPDYAPTNSSGMSWSASGENAFIKNNLSPALGGAGLSTKIFGFDHNWNDTSFVKTLLNDPTTRNDLAGIAWHCYSGNPSAMTTMYTSDHLSLKAQMNVEEWKLESFLERNQRRSRSGYREQGTINGSQASGSTWYWYSSINR